MKKGELIVIITSTGLEIIGKVTTVSDHMCTLESPCVLPDVEHLILFGDFVVYSRNNEVRFNRDVLIADYDPSDAVAALYNEFIVNEAHEIAKMIVDKTVENEVENLRNIEVEDPEKLKEAIKDIAQGLGSPEKVKKKEANFGTGPKVLTMEDILSKTLETTKKKLN